MENGREEGKENRIDDVKTGAIIGEEAANPPWSWEKCGDFYTGPSSSMTFKEPIQGKADDCFFIAALSSVAWVSYTLLRAPTNPKNPLNFTFYDTVAGGDVHPQLSNQDLAKKDGAMLFATGVTGKTWPGLYEKAFAKWKNCTIVQGADYLDIRELKIKGGSAVNALMNITGLKNPDICNVINNQDPSNELNWLNSDNRFNATGKSNKPMVASTGSTGTGGIYTDHSYSLLGIANSGGSTFIILRNPYGKNAIKYVDPNPSRPTGIWNGINLATNTDGVFPIDVVQFKKYFKNMGRVY